MITHIVLFGFRPEVSAEEQRALTDEMLSFKDKCFREGTQERYIINVSGGRNETAEGAANGLSHSVSPPPPVHSQWSVIVDVVLKL